MAVPVLACEVREEEHSEREEARNDDGVPARDPFGLHQIEREKQHDRRLEVAVRERAEARGLDLPEEGTCRRGHDRRRLGVDRLAGLRRLPCPCLGRLAGVRGLVYFAAAIVRVELERHEQGREGREAAGHDERLRNRRDGHDPFRREGADDVADGDRHGVERRHVRLHPGGRAREQDRLAAHPDADRARAIHEAVAYDGVVRHERREDRDAGGVAEEGRDERSLGGEPLDHSAHREREPHDAEGEPRRERSHLRLRKAAEVEVVCDEGDGYAVCNPESQDRRVDRPDVLVANLREHRAACLLRGVGSQGA